MKTESTVKPVAPYEIEYDGDMAKITFYKNVLQKAVEEDEAEKWEYDMYQLSVFNRDTLTSSIDSDLDAWFQTAKDVEYGTLASKVRVMRDVLLTGSDWTQTLDTPLTDAEKEKWRVYRQELRDMPQQEGFPYQVVWPNA